MPFVWILVTALLLCNVLLRVLTNGLEVLPKALNIIDVPLSFGILFVALHYPKASSSGELSRVSARTTAFVVVCIIGSLLNFPYLHPPAAISQLTMLLEPLALLIAFGRLPVMQDQVSRYTKLLGRLILLQVVLGIFQFPRFLITGNSEELIGTFSGNAEHYGFFLATGIFFYIGKSACDPARWRKYSFLVVCLLVLTLCIDNKASWLGLAVSSGLALSRVPSPMSAMVRKAGGWLAIPIVGALIVLVVVNISATVSMFGNLSQAWSTGRMGDLGKIRAYTDTLKSHVSSPHMLLVGSGLGTFYSRSSRQFYSTLYFQSQVNPNLYGHGEKGGSPSGSAGAWDSAGGVIEQTDRDPYYAQFIDPNRPLFPIGSEQVDGPFSPYAGLLGETGLLGTILYLGVFLRAFRLLGRLVREPSNSQDSYPLVVAAYGALIYILVNSVYGPFLETGRLTTILATLVGAASMLDPRRQAVRVPVSNRPSPAGLSQPSRP